MQPDEQEIQFKKRARRRLVGAIALVLLMVTILPMVLDDRSTTQPQQEIAITIPSQDGEDFTSSIVPNIPEPVAIDTTDLSAEIVDDPEAQTDAVAAASQAEHAEKEQPATKATGSKPVDSKPAASKPVASPPAPAKPAETPTFMIQIGVFSDAANVRQLEQKLKAGGFNAQTEKLQTPQGEKIRLRTGPFATRPLAEAALVKIKDAGLSGMIITNK